jgi:hypothetical protein
MWRIGHAASQSPEVDWHTVLIALNTRGGFDRGFDRRRRRAERSRSSRKTLKCKTQNSRPRPQDLGLKTQNLKGVEPQDSHAARRVRPQRERAGNNLKSNILKSNNDPKNLKKI